MKLSMPSLATGMSTDQIAPLVGYRNGSTPRLANHGVKALVFETRAQENLTTTMQQRESLFARLAEPSVRAIGMEPAPTAARLIIALTSEAALIEMEAGRKHPGARDIIRLLLNSASETAATAEEK
jgi:hypothetical protein